MSTTEAHNINTSLKLMQQILQIELESLQTLIDQIDPAAAQVLDKMKHCKGKVVVTGMGKSGHVARKMAATLASTGCPAFFVHPADAMHGDLGMISAQDLVVALCHSGKTDEIIKLLPFIKKRQSELIAITGDPNSPLALQSSIHLHVPITREACPLALAPTSSTTAMMAMGDALAMALMMEKGFKKTDFAALHPGGSLGKQLSRQ